MESTRNCNKFKYLCKEDLNKNFNLDKISHLGAKFDNIRRYSNMINTKTANARKLQKHKISHYGIASETRRFNAVFTRALQ